MVERAAFSINLSKLQPLQGDLIVIGRERSFFEKLFGFFGGFGRVSSQHALVKNLRRRKSWSVPAHDVEEFQAFDMTSQHHYTTDSMQPASLQPASMEVEECWWI